MRRQSISEWNQRSSFPGWVALYGQLRRGNRDLLSIQPKTIDSLALGFR